MVQSRECKTWPRFGISVVIQMARLAECLLAMLITELVKKSMVCSGTGAFYDKSC